MLFLGRVEENSVYDLSQIHYNKAFLNVSSIHFEKVNVLKRSYRISFHKTILSIKNQIVNIEKIKEDHKIRVKIKEK